MEPGTPPAKHPYMGPDSWRVLSNIAIDGLLYGEDLYGATYSNPKLNWIENWSQRLTKFLSDQDINSYVCYYSIDGAFLEINHDLGLLSTATALLTQLPSEFNHRAKNFIKEAFEAEAPP